MKWREGRNEQEKLNRWRTDHLSPAGHGSYDLDAGYHQGGSSSRGNAVVLSNEPDLDWQQNGKNNEYVTYLLEGSLRVKAAAGTVLSDANCEADEQGISRCHNEIALSDTQKITVVNVHNMNNYACLAPGDAVNIEPYAEGWLKVTKTGDGQ